MSDAIAHMWSQGDYTRIAPYLMDAVHHLVDLGRIGPEQRVLDVGTGSGSVAVLAARRAAEVTAIDLTDAWFDTARASAEAAGVSIAFDVGDVQSLPYDDDSFDRVVSNFAMIFAPDHDATARELVRVCRPGGAIAFTAWVDGGAFGQAFEVLRAAMPEPDGGWPTPSGRWGDPDYIRERFEGSGTSWGFHPEAIRFAFDSLEVYDAFLDNSGPYVAARAVLEPLGAWPVAHDEMLAVLEAGNVAEKGGFELEQPYLLAVGLLDANT